MSRLMTNRLRGRPSKTEWRGADRVVSQAPYPHSLPEVTDVIDRVRLGATRLLMRAVRAYQVSLSPLLGAQCRFHPTCSNYALLALERHGPIKGAWLALRRLLKCHPFHPGGIDPPPGMEDR